MTIGSFSQQTGCLGGKHPELFLLQTRFTQDIPPSLSPPQVPAASTGASSTEAYPASNLAVSFQSEKHPELHGAAVVRFDGRSGGLLRWMSREVKERPRPFDVKNGLLRRPKSEVS